MKSFDYLRRGNHYYQPKTPQTALRAVELGVLPIEAFIYMSSSVKPLYEEPYDLRELERILFRENNDLETNLLLMQIFQVLIKNPDPEIALFGAECINTLESRYTTKIDHFKKRLSENWSAEEVREAASLYYDFALLNRDRTIRNYYLKEAYSLIKEISNRTALKREDGIFIVRILLALNLPNQALSILSDLAKNFGVDSELLFLEGEINYQKRDFKRVFNSFKKMEKARNKLDLVQRGTYSFWMGD